VSWCEAGEGGLKVKLPGEGQLSPSHCYQFDVSPSNRRPEKDHRSAGEHLKSSTKELQPVSQLHQVPNLSVSTQTHAAWGVSKRGPTSRLERDFLQGPVVIGQGIMALN